MVVKSALSFRTRFPGFLGARVQQVDKAPWVLADFTLAHQDPCAWVVSHFVQSRLCPMEDKPLACYFLVTGAILTCGHTNPLCVPWPARLPA